MMGIQKPLATLKREQNGASCATRWSGWMTTTGGCASYKIGMWRKARPRRLMSGVQLVSVLSKSGPTPQCRYSAQLFRFNDD